MVEERKEQLELEWDAEAVKCKGEKIKNFFFFFLKNEELIWFGVTTVMMRTRERNSAAKDQMKDLFIDSDQLKSNK